MGLALLRKYSTRTVYLHVRPPAIPARVDQSSPFNSVSDVTHVIFTCVSGQVAEGTRRPGHMCVSQTLHLLVPSRLAGATLLIHRPEGDAPPLDMCARTLVSNTECFSASKAVDLRALLATVPSCTTGHSHGSGQHSPDSGLQYRHMVSTWIPAPCYW